MEQDEGSRVKERKRGRERKKSKTDKKQTKISRYRDSFEMPLFVISINSSRYCIPSVKDMHMCIASAHVWSIPRVKVWKLFMINSK